MFKQMRFFFVLAAIMLATLVNAQVTTSSISGMVTEQNKEPLVGATVKATHTPTGTVYFSTTQMNGKYSIVNARIGGPYLLEISYVGFNTESLSGINLVLGEDQIVNVVLKEDALALGEVLVVGEKNPVISGNRTGAQEIITREKMDLMPTINRSLSDFTKLTPMSSGNNFGGTSYRFNNVTVDGASFNNSFGLSSSLGAAGTEPISLEAIEQIQVMIAPYDVRNGAFTGAGVNSVTKSGSNSWMATAYMYTKSPSMTGYRQNDDIAPVSEFSNHQYGASLSGSIIKNKLFFFINGEIDRQDRPINWRARETPNDPVSGNISAADKESLQDLSNFLGEKFNYNPGSFNTTSTPTQADRLTARIDWNINNKNSLSVKYFYLKSFNTNMPSTSGQPSGGRGPNEFSIPFSSSYYRNNNNFNIFMADLNTTINNQMSNTLKIGYSALRDYREMDGGFFPQVDIENGSGKSFTTFGTENNSYNNQLDSDIFQIQDNFLWNIGNHSITVGTQSDYRSFANGFAAGYAGQWKFRSIQDFKDDVNNHFAWVNAGSDPATRPTSKAYQYSQKYNMTDGDFPFAKVDVLSLGFYLQDKWAVTPNFNLTVGVRVDTPIFMTDLAPNPTIAALTFQGGRKIDVSKYPKTSPLFSPRIGFNYDVFNNQTLQVRGGTGIFSGTPPYVWLSNQAGNNGLLFGETKALDHAFDGVVNYPKPSGAELPKASIAVSENNFKYPQLWKSNLAVDYKFGDGWVATVEVLYNKDLNAIYHMNINLPDYDDATKATKLGGADNRPYFIDNTLNDGVTDAILMRNTSKGYSIYTTLQLQKNFRTGVMKGLYLNGSYSFGKSKGVTDGSSSVASSAWKYRAAIDPNSEELGYSSGSFPNRLLLQASYYKDWGKNYRTSMGLTYQRYCPFRYSYTYSGDVNNDYQDMNDLIFIPATRDQIKIKSNDKRTEDEIWNQIDAFIKQDPYLKDKRGEYAERNGAKAPYANQLDLNLTHDFKLSFKNKTHTLRLSFDIQNFLNLLNKDWGVQQTTVLGNQQYQFLKMTDKPSAANNFTPSFTMDLDNRRDVITKTFKDYVSSASRWQMQFGIKYIFN